MLVGISKVRDTLGINPYAIPPETGFKALDADNGEQEPKEADQKSNIDEQWCGLLQTTENNLVCCQLSEGEGKRCALPLCR